MCVCGVGIGVDVSGQSVGDEQSMRILVSVCVSENVSSDC